MVHAAWQADGADRFPPVISSDTPEFLAGRYTYWPRCSIKYGQKRQRAEDIGADVDGRFTISW